VFLSYQYFEGCMVEVIRVERASQPIYLGDVEINVFRLPNGQYVLNKTDIAKAIGKAAQYVSDFLIGKSPQALPYKGLTFQKYPVYNERTTIDAVSIELATAFWRYWDKRDNIKANLIIDACVSESIERRADKIFAVNRSEADYNQKFTQNLKSFEVIPEPYNSFSISPYGAKENPIVEITPDIVSGYGWSNSEKIMEDWVVLLSSYSNMQPWRQIPQRSYGKTAKVKTRRFDFLIHPRIPIYKNLGQVLVLTDFKSNYIDAADVSDTCLTKNYPVLALNQSERFNFDTLIFQLVSPAGITQDGVHMLNTIQRILTEQYGEKIKLDALRLDDMVWNQIYPAIEGTYKDECGVIGNQFSYIKEEVLQLCQEICNPDLWVAEYKNFKDKTFKLIKARQRLFLPGHPPEPFSNRYPFSANL
jgi:hypothetical protein